MSNEHIKPEDRTRFDNPISNLVGKTLGQLSLLGFQDSYYYTVSSALASNPGAESKTLTETGLSMEIMMAGEDQLSRILFGLAPSDKYEPVFMQNEDTGDWVIANNESGREYQEVLNHRYTDLVLHDYFYPDKGWDEEYDKGMKKYSVKRHPDTGNLGFMIDEPVMQDIYVGKDGNFYEFWNIGLDKKENLLFEWGEGRTLPYAKLTNLKRLAAAPFTKPPHIFGKVELLEEDIAPWLEHIKEVAPNKYKSFEEQVSGKLTAKKYKKYLEGYFNSLME
jgi:hypothetical protein